jgi:hypothetical protein
MEYLLTLNPKILRVAALNTAAYEWLVVECPSLSVWTFFANRIQHEPVGRDAGLTSAQLKVIRSARPFADGKEVKATLGPSLAAALRFADFMTNAIHVRPSVNLVAFLDLPQVPDAVYAELKAFLTDEEMVEAVATTGAYNLASRLLVALNVDGKMNTPVPIPA